MLTFLPAGLLGLVIASLIAAFMSTISTHLNWGSSYIVHDFYHRFFDPNASQPQLVTIGRWSTVVLMVLASLLALTLESALDGFGIILQIGAGTGLIYILRWFWWRINAMTEITGMVVSFAVAVFFQFGYSLTELPELASWQQLVIGIAVTTTAWLMATILSPPSNDETLERFCECIRPGGVGWKPVYDRLAKRGKQLEPRDSITAGLKAMFASTFLVYAILFGAGYLLYGEWIAFLGSLVIAAIAATALYRTWPTLRLL